MKKIDLIRKVSEATNISQKDTALIIQAFTDVVKEAVSKDDKVQIIGFGSFELRSRAARKGINPLTGKEMTVPASKVPVFRAGKGFKEQVDAGKRG